MSFLISILITNLFDAKIYGDYILVFSTVDMLAIFSLLGYNQLFSIEVPKLKTNTEKLRLFYTARRKTLISSILISCTLFFLSYYFNFRSKGLYQFVLSAIISIPIISLTLLNSNFLFSLKKIVITQVNDKIIRVVLFIAFIFLAYYRDKTIYAIIVAYIASSLVTFFISYILRKRTITTSEKIPNIQESHFTKSIYLLVIINCLNIIFSKIDGLQIAYFLGAEYAGINNVYMKLASAITLVMTSTILIFTPKISKVIALERYDLVKKEISKIFKFVTPIGLLLGILITVISPYFFLIYKTNIYSTEIQSLNIYSISALLKILCGPALVILLLSKKLKYLIYGNILELTINFILNCLLIPTFKMKGAACASLISELIVNLYFAFVCFKLFRINTLFFGK